MSGATKCKDGDGSPKGRSLLDVRLMSFGYKQGAPPLANLTFDVRFLKNPFWIDELRPLNGRDKPVQDYVMEQPLAREFFNSVIHMLDAILPELCKQEKPDFTIAFGCTGGQHRSATLVETLASEMSKRYANCRIMKEHRELDAASKSDELLSGAHTTGTLVKDDED